MIINSTKFNCQNEKLPNSLPSNLTANQLGRSVANLTGIQDCCDGILSFKNGNYFQSSMSLAKAAVKGSLVAGILCCSYEAWRQYQDYATQQTLDQIGYDEQQKGFEAAPEALSKAFHWQLDKDWSPELNKAILRCGEKNWNPAGCQHILKLGDREWSDFAEKRPGVAGRLLWGCRDSEKEECRSIKAKALNSWDSFAPGCGEAAALQYVYCTSGKAKDSSICSEMISTLIPKIETISTTNFKFVKSTVGDCLKSTNDMCKKVVETVFESDAVALSQSTASYAAESYWEMAERACQVPDSDLCTAGKKRIFKIWDESLNSDRWPALQKTFMKCKRHNNQGVFIPKSPELCKQMKQYVNT